MNKITGLLILSLFICACDNPFGEDEIKGENRTITGVVSLSGLSNAKGVYVWLDVLNIGTFTDESGAFTLTLPPKSALNASGTVTGDFDLYFYTINHALVIKKVVVKDGSIMYENGDVDKNGSINNINLLKSFDVETRPVYPLPNEPGRQSGLSVTAHFKSILGNAKINIPNGTMILLGGCFVINKETGHVHIYELPGTGKPFISSLSRQEQIWSFHPNTGDEILYRTPYQVIPFVFPYHAGLPEELLASMDVSETTLNENYLSILFSGEFGQFERPEEL